MQLNWILEGDCLDRLKQLPSQRVELIYIDPPFNNSKTQKRTRIQSQAVSGKGDRVGYGGKNYHTISSKVSSWTTEYTDFLDFLIPRIEASLHTLTDNGSFFLHLDYREVHYCKVILDTIFGRENFVSEIIWAYDYGARSRTKWPAKHDTILWYAKDINNYIYNYDNMDRIPYMAPKLVTPEKAALGKTPTDVWWHTIVGTNSKEKTGYATQKPLEIMERIIKIHSNPGSYVLDFFAGSGTTGEAAALHKRKFCLIDCNPEAIHIMKQRLHAYLTAQSFSS